MYYEDRSSRFNAVSGLVCGALVGVGAALLLGSRNWTGDGGDSRSGVAGGSPTGASRRVGPRAAPTGVRG